MNLRKVINTLIFSLLALSISAQNSTESNKIQNKIWNKAGVEFHNTTIPEKLKNESAVILFQDYQYLFDRKGAEVNSKISYHLRVALLDKAAIKEYSEFSFTERFLEKSTHQYNRGRTYMGLKIIKPDGTERIIDIKTAVSVQSKIYDNSVKKIAIPDLQKGDIIDYYYHAIEITSAAYAYHTFSPIFTSLGTDYPIVYFRRQFEVDDKFFVNYHSVNGAPEFTIKQKEDFKVFTLEARNIEKIEPIYWSYPYRSLPTIKFQVMYSANVGFINYLNGFVSGTENIKSELDSFDFANFGNLLVSNPYKVDLVKLKTFSAKNGKLFDILSSREKAKQVYYFLYHITIRERLEKYLLGVDKANVPGLSDYYFVQSMAAYFKALKLRGELLLTTHREFTSLEEAILKGEFGFVIRWVGQGDLYFGKVNFHPHINSIPTEYEGAEAYVFPIGRETWELKKETLPISNYKSNRTVTSSKFSFDEDMEKMNLHNNTKTFGHNRDWFQYSLLTMYDYLTEENRRMGTPSIMKSVRENKKIEMKETISEYNKDADKERMKVLESVVAIELKTKNPVVSNFNIIKNGRFDEGIFEFEYDAKFEGLIQQAGTEDYLFNIGFLIGQQKEIKENNMTRKEDIYIPHAHTHINIITCSIPEGYRVEGLEKLTFNIMNETGGFISSASMDGNTLNIKTEKWYSNNFEKAENWSKMLEYLEAAYEFTGVKVLLKKQ